MASQAVAAIGSAIKRNGIAIAEMKSIDLSGAKLDLVDTTNMQSVGGYKEWLPTLREGGEVSMTGNYLTGGTQATLQADFDGGTVQAWSIEIANPVIQTCSFNAYVMDVGFKLAHDKAAEVSFKLKVTGPKVFA